MLLLSPSARTACVTDILLGHMLLKIGAEAYFFLLSLKARYITCSINSSTSMKEYMNNKRTIQCLISHLFRNLNFILKSEYFYIFAFTLPTFSNSFFFYGRKCVSEHFFFFA